MSEKKPAEFSTEEMVERTFYQDLSNSLYADPTNPEHLMVAVDVAEQIVLERKRANREARTERGERTEVADEAFTDYLHNIGKVALLGTREDEYRMFWAYEIGQFAASRLEEQGDVGDVEDQYLDLAKLRDWAFDEIFVANSRLVVSHAKNRAFISDLIPEFTSVGNEGLHRAVELFDAERGIKFSTYANRWIRQAMQRGERDILGALKIPHHVLSQFYSMQKIRRDYYDETGEDLADEDLARASGIPLDTIRGTDDAVRSARDSMSLQHEVGEDGGLEVGDSIATTHSDDEQRELHDLELLDAIARKASEREIPPFHLALFLADAGMLDPETAAEVRAQAGVMRKDQRERIVRVTRNKLMTDDVLSLLTDGASDE